MGTLPPPRFTQRKLKKGDVDFCYGSRNGLLWPVLDKMFNLHLDYENTERAVKQRKDFLRSRDLGICDMVAASYREKIDASDLGMQDVELRNFLKIVKEHPKIQTLLFTGGNSKNGPEYFFRRHLKETESEIQLQLISKATPKIHQFRLDNRFIKTVSLTAPSGSANRAIGSMKFYKHLKTKHPEFNTIDFRVLQYKEFF